MSGLCAEDLGVEIAGKPVVQNLNFCLQPGECWAILGENGVGKTTLLHTLAGLRAPGHGSVNLDSRPLAQYSSRIRSQKVGVLFQNPEDPFPATVEDTVLIGRHPFQSAWIQPDSGFWQWESEIEQSLATAVLSEVGLENCRQRSVLTLSGGERQRLAVASVLIQDPLYFLLDEPSNHLDLPYQIEMMNCFARRVENHAAGVLMVLHDVNLALRFSSHLILLFGKGRFEVGRVDEVLNQENLSRLYHYPVVELNQGGHRAFIAG